MIKKILMSGCAAIAFLTAGTAQADTAASGWYTGLSGDFTWLPHSNLGGGANVDLGYEFWPSTIGDFRLEGEFGYHGVPNDHEFTGNTHYYTYMGNLYYDFTGLNNLSYGGWNVVPYVGAGLGDATVRFGGSHSSGFASFGDNDNVFAYQFMGGLSFTNPYTPHTDWLIGYKYTGSDSTSVPGISHSLNASNLEIGLQYHF